MRVRKIVDTIENFGAAEKYIQFDAGFERFLRKKYNRADIKSINAHDIAKKYNLKGIVFGNYLTQEERFFYLFKTHGQLEFLAKLMKSNDIGKGTLIVAFGVEGKSKANAHYDPNKQLINLNRGRKTNYKYYFKGEGSFVHEFGHFIDFSTGRTDNKIRFNFSSEAYLNGEGSSKTRAIADATKITFDVPGYVDGLSHYSNSEYLMKPWEMFARLFERTIHEIAQSDPNYKPFFDRNYSKPTYLKSADLKKNKLPALIKRILKGF